MVPPQFPHVFP
jgi:hypothetical protein